LFFVECNILPGGYRVKCDDPKCGFSGTIFELMAKAQGKPLSEVFYNFMPDEEFYDTFVRKGRSKSAYRSGLINDLAVIGINTDLQRYLKKCNEDMIMSAPLRAALSDYGIMESMFPRLTIGRYNKLLPDSVTPAKIADSKEDRFIIPYTCHGMIVDLQVMSVNDRSRKHFTINEDKAQAGIFQEEFLSGEGMVNVCQNEISAMLLASKINEYTNKPSNAVFLVSNRSTEYLADEQPIRLISTEDNELRLDRAVHFWKKRNERQIFVTEIPGKLSAFNGGRISLILNKPDKVEDWIVDHIVEINATKSITELKSIIASLALNAVDKTDLLTLLIESGKADPILLSVVKETKTEDSERVYGKFRFKRTASCYIEGRGHAKKLSSCVFYADAVTDDDKGEKVLIGRLKTDVPDEPMYRIALPTKKLATTKGSTVGELIWSKIKEQGSQYRPYLSDLYGGPTWFDLLIGFDDTDYIDSMMGLGLQGDKIINFPNARVDVQTGAVMDGHPAVLAAGNAIDSYNEIVCGKLDEDALREIVLSDNKLLRRTTLIICHILHQIATSAVSGTRYVPKHLIVPYAIDDDVWYNACIQAYSILSGRMRPPALPEVSQKFPPFEKDNKQLGTLPGIYLCRLSKPLRDWMYSSSNSLVLLTQCIDTTPLSRETFTYFSYDEETEVLSRDYLDEDVCNVFRKSIPRLILKFVNKVVTKYDCGPNILPAERGMKWLQEELGVDAAYDDVSIKLHYTVKGQNSKDLFLSLIADEVLNHRSEIAVNFNVYKANHESYIGYYSKDHLFLKLSKSIKALGSMGGAFSAAHLLEQSDRTKRGELKVDRAQWHVHYIPDRGKALSLGDLTLLKKSS